MAQTENRLDFSPQGATPTGSVTAISLPNYALYGDAATRPDWFVNIEPLELRSSQTGWTIAPHTHTRFTQLVLCCDGSGEMTIEGDTRRFRAGSVMIVPPFRIHGFRYAEATRGWVLTIESHYLAGLLARAPALEVVLRNPGVFDVDATILPACEKELVGLVGELVDRSPAATIGAEIRLLAVLLLLLRHWPDGASPCVLQGGRSETVRRFKEIVEQRYREHLALPGIAVELGVSVSQLRLACHQVAGVSPIGMMHDRIVSEAKRCLAYSTMTISEISDWLGFADAAYFSRFFSKATSQTASSYRRNQSGIGNRKLAEKRVKSS